MESNRREESLNLVTILLFMRKWKWVLIGVTVLAAVPTYFISKSIPPEYESYSVIFPSVSRNRDRLLQDFDFGYEVHAERLVQLLDSDAMKDSVIEKFSLVEYYGIDQSKKTWYDDLLEMYYQRIHFNKTKYKSVVILAQDRDPEMAASIANEIARLVNVISNNITKSSGQEALRSVEEDFKKIEGQLSGLNDSISIKENKFLSTRESRLGETIRQRSQRINNIRKKLDEMRKEHKIYDYGYQVNVLNEKYAAALEKELDAKGKLEVYKGATAASDSLILRAEAEARSAESRKKYFEKELGDLTSINQVYTQLETDLSQETELLKDARKEYQTIQSKVIPEISSRNIEALENDYSYDKERLNELKSQYEDAQSNFYNPVPVAYVVSKARASYKKVYPNTKLNIIMVVFFALFFTCIVLLIRERLKEINQSV